ncbi:hypothetical protein LCGC14_2818550 [marine sediment metagenome]|uniref:Uncharacterized protein n=1 Tax=marine sediment metagenome TaxID=412755 RepID=A0A0F8YHS3_9ZZZZ
MSQKDHIFKENYNEKVLTLSKKKGFNSRNNLFSFPNNSKKEGKEIN